MPPAPTTVSFTPQRMDRPLRALHVYRTYFPDPPGGLQEAIRQISVGTAQHGVEATVFTLSPQPHPATLERAEGRVVRCRSWAAPASCDLGGLQAVRTFARLAREADILHYHFPWPFADLLDAMVRPATPAVMTYHSDIVRQRGLNLAYAPLRQHMLGRMARIVATSPAYARTSSVLADPGVAPRVRVIPLGMDVPAADTPALLPARLGLAPDEPFFLFIGVLRYYKGLETLVRAAATVQAPIVIAGSGPEAGRLVELATTLGASNVRFAGQVSDAEKQALLQHCRALVLPSHLRSEAYGMVLVEAAMSGRPMVSCEIGTGTSFVNQHEKTGLVVPPQDPQALGLALRRLLEDQAFAARCGLSARQRYEQHLSATAMGRAYAALYRDVLARREHQRHA